MDKSENAKARERERKLFERLCRRSDDPVLQVLRAHLMAESYLERFIISRIERGDRLIENGNLSFYQKVAVAESLDLLPTSTIEALRALNKLRNGCAHDVEKRVSNVEIDSLGRPFQARFIKWKNEAPSAEELLYTVLSAICAAIAGATAAAEHYAISTVDDNPKSKETKRPKS